MAIPYSRYVFASLPWYSALIVCGILAAVWLIKKEAIRRGLPGDTAYDIALVTVPSGIIGARLYYVAMTWESFRLDPLSILYIWEGGIAIYGGVIGGAIGALIYAKCKKLSFLQLADCAAPGLLLAQALGRWGNYFNMEAYGPQITNAAFQFFPAGVLISENGQWVWHMATFFYESLWNLCGFAAIWLMRKRLKHNGDTLCWYFLIYGSGRFIIEQLREDSLYLGSYRVSQYLSLALCAVSAGVLIWRALGSNRKHMIIGLLAACALLARWFALGSVWLYALLMLTAALCAVLALCEDKRSLLWLMLPLCLDALGLICLALGWPSASLSMRAHTLLCSVTLPVYIAISTKVLTCEGGTASCHQEP